MHSLAALALATLLLLGCQTPAAGTPPLATGAPRVDPLAAAVLDQFGHQATGPTELLTMPVGDLQEQPWSLYLEVSREAGMDFGALEGRPAVLLETPVEGQADDTAVFVLTVEGRPVGAWLSPGGSSSGVLPVNADP